MTVIIGINLSNRTYLAGDSRLSYYQGGEMYVRNDNMQKVENVQSSRSVTIASAGDARFAKFVLNKLKTADFINGNISEIRVALVEWIGLVANDYFTQYGYSSVTLIIGGSDPTRKKVVSGAQFREMANSVTGGQGMIYMNSALQTIAAPGTRIPDGDVELDAPDTQLFSVKITQNGIEFTDTKWGEFLIYGPEGLVRDDIGAQDIAKFEFDPTFRENGSGMGNDMALLNAFVYSQAEKHHLSSVGGSVVAFANNGDGTTHIVTGIAYMVPLSELSQRPGPQQIQPTVINSILIQGNDIYRELNGTRYKLIPVSKYRPQATGEMLL
jgi:hypothetical protein